MVTSSQTNCLQTMLPCIQMSTRAGPKYLSSLCSPLSAVTTVVSCGQQPKATSITREHELSHTAHGHLQFLDLHAGTYFRHLWSHRRWNPLIFVNSWRQYSWCSRRNYVTRFARR